MEYAIAIVVLLAAAFVANCGDDSGAIDAAAADLSECFTTKPDYVPYRLQDVDRRIFDPDKARVSSNGKPSVRMDAPRGK